jgi:cholesterol oxidase
MSLHVGEVPDEVDVLVIGSGFGGSVIAARLAEEGRQVCVVERGKSYPPGSFPRTPAGLSANFWDPSDGRHGMFDVWSFRSLEAVVSSGLGGGSLIYANVMLRKPEAWFCHPHPYQPGVNEQWTFGYGDLEPHYDRVEKFLRVQTLPNAEADVDVPEGFNLPKTAAFRAAAGRVVPVHYAPLAVRFRGEGDVAGIGLPLPDEQYSNIFGVPRRTCRMLGECDVGCNEGAKNSLDHTYLSAASFHGASIHERTEVRHVTRRVDGSFDVDVVVHRPEQEGVPTPTRQLPVSTIRARRVVVSAGALGSTFLLLANRQRLGLDNPALGSRFCGNGDLLGFIMNASRDLESTLGPVITAYAGYPDKTDTGSSEDRGMYIQDAGFPVFAAWLAEVSQSSGLARRTVSTLIRRGAARLAGHRNTAFSHDITSILGRGQFSSRSLPVLGMGRDVPDGTLYLRDESCDPPMLDSTWTTRTSTRYFEMMIARMRAIADVLDGDFTINPTYLLRRVITVHPLGGCPASTNVSPGVVDGWGQVYGVPGLRVCDGSVFPGPVGANPSLTIAAFADRVADSLLDESPSDRAPDVAEFMGTP